MNKKLFAFDVDGTLLDHKTRTIPISAMETVKELRKQGHIVGVATGRNQSQFEKALNAKDFDFVMLCNGGYVEVNGHKIYDIQFSQKDKVYLCDLLDDLDYQYTITTEHHLYSKNPYHEKVQKTIKAFDVITPEKKQDVRTLPVYQFTIYESVIPDKILDELKKDLLSIL